MTNNGIEILRQLADDLEEEARQVERLDREADELRRENARLRDEVDRLKEDAEAGAALRRAEHAKPEPETCVWTMDEGEWHTACGNDESFEDCDPINTGFYTYCPFCGKRIEVKK